jgi:hypothetical protein
MQVEQDKERNRAIMTNRGGGILMACWYCKHDIGRFHNGDGCKYTLCDCKLDKADASAPPAAAPPAAAPPAAAPPAAKRDEKSYQDVAVRSIADREKRREEEKSKTPESTVKVSDPIIKEQALQKDKTGNDNKDETTIKGVFESSKSDSMVEMEKSAAIKEREHPEEVLTSVEKAKSIDPTTTKVTKISEVNVDSPPRKATTFPNVSPQNLDERAANLRDSKEEQIMVGSKEPSQEEIIEIKDKKTDAEPPLSQGLDESYTNFWLEATKSWTDLYVESARNVAEATEYWLGLFFKPWLSGGRSKDRSI